MQPKQRNWIKNLGLVLGAGVLWWALPRSEEAELRACWVQQKNLGSAIEMYVLDH